MVITFLRVIYRKYSQSTTPLWGGGWGLTCCFDVISEMNIALISRINYNFTFIYKEKILVRSIQRFNGFKLAVKLRPQWCHRLSEYCIQSSNEQVHLMNDFLTFSDASLQKYFNFHWHKEKTFKHLFILSKLL